MKRDMDLVRAIARALHDAPPTKGQLKMPVIEGRTDEEIGYNTYLMAQAGLVEVANFKPVEKAVQYAIPLALTWQGEDFFSAAADDSLWAAAKEKVIGPAGTVAFSVLLEWLKAEALRRLGL